MSYTLDEIKRIHSKKLALPNRQYKAVDGSIYVGTKEKRLEKLDLADSVITENNYSSISGENVEEVLQSIDNEISSVSQNGYKTFSYDGSGNLISKNVYEDSSMSNLLYTFAYSYSGTNLTQIDVVRISDSFAYQKILTYDVNDVLTSINLI